MFSLAFGLQPRGSVTDGVAEDGNVNGLFHIVDSVKENRRAIVFLVGVTAHENDLTVRQNLAELPAQRDSVHSRHTDVGNDNVRRKILQNGEGLIRVLRCTDFTDLQRIPVYMMKNPISDEGLVFYQ